jgi:sulfide:quinone oxidoreductase
MEHTQLSPQFAVSPQIREHQIDAIAAAGFAGIINNRPDDEEAGQPKSAELETAAKRQGLWYLHIPVLPAGATEADAHALATAIREHKGPILAFCRTGTRSTNLWKAVQQMSTGSSPRRCG